MKCAECGAMLKVVMFNRLFWIIYFFTSIAVIFFAFTYKTYIPQLGFNTTAIIWIALVCVLFFIFTVGMWRYSSAEKVE